MRVPPVTPFADIVQWQDSALVMRQRRFDSSLSAPFFCGFVLMVRMPVSETGELGSIPRPAAIHPRSSNGRTRGFDPRCGGSTPSRGTNNGPFF